MKDQQTAGQKAAITRNKNFEAMTHAEKEKVTSQRKAAANKAWDTIRANKEKAKRSAAAKKAWKTIRANKAAAKRSASAKKAWVTIRANKSGTGKKVWETILELTGK